MRWLIPLVLFAVSACRGGDPQLAIALNASSGGDPARGSAVIQQYGCGSCHLIPGVAGASSLVGPPLISFARRSFVGGELPNTPDNAAFFIQTPQKVHPHSAMPTVGLSREQARDVVAYLYTLR
jgi:cytochrome c